MKWDLIIVITLDVAKIIYLDLLCIAVQNNTTLKDHFGINQKEYG
jgi:hypothetical protein